MAKAMLYSYAVLYHPAPKKDGVGNTVDQKSEIILEPATLLAVDDAQARMLIARLIPPKLVEHLAELQVIVRPF